MSISEKLAYFKSPFEKLHSKKTTKDQLYTQVVQAHQDGIHAQNTWKITLGMTAVLLSLWFLASFMQWVSPLFLPGPQEVVLQFIDIFKNGYAGATLGQHVSASLLRMFTALLIALGLGIPLGLLMGMNRWIKGALDAPIGFYWPLPPLAYLPLMIIWLGIGEVSKVTLLSLAIFAPICLAAQAGVRSLPIARLHAAQSLGATRWQLFVSIIWPTALPEIITGLRIGISVGWSCLVAAELIAATRGIGFMIMSASHFLATDVVFVGILLISLCAFISSRAIHALEKHYVPWKGKT